MIRNKPLYIIKTSPEGKPRLEDSKLWDSLVWLHSVGGEEDEAATSDRKIHNLKVRSIASKSTCLSWRSAILPCGGTEPERTADLYRQQKDEDLRLCYTIVGGEVLDERVQIRGIRDADNMKTIFKRQEGHLLKVAIRKGVKQRFIEAKEVAQQNAFIFEPE